MLICSHYKNFHINVSFTALHLCYNKEGQQVRGSTLPADSLWHTQPLNAVPRPQSRIVAGRGPRYSVSWHLSPCFSISAAEVLNFPSTFVFFFRTQSSQGLCVQIVIHCKDNTYLYFMFQQWLEAPCPLRQALRAPRRRGRPAPRSQVSLLHSAALMPNWEQNRACWLQ